MQILLVKWLSRGQPSSLLNYFWAKRPFSRLTETWGAFTSRLCAHRNPRGKAPLLQALRDYPGGAAFRIITGVWLSRPADALHTQPHAGPPPTSGQRETEAGVDLGEWGRPAAEKRGVHFGWGPGGAKQTGSSLGPKGN